MVVVVAFVLEIFVVLMEYRIDTSNLIYYVALDMLVRYKYFLLNKIILSKCYLLFYKGNSGGIKKLNMIRCVDEKLWEKRKGHLLFRCPC